MKRNGNADRRRRENRGAEGGGRGAEGAEGVGVWGGGVPLPRKKMILALNMVSFSAFWMLFFTVQLPVL